MRTARITKKTQAIIAALQATRQDARNGRYGSATLAVAPLGRTAADVRSIATFTGFVCDITPDGNHVVVYA